MFDSQVEALLLARLAAVATPLDAMHSNVSSLVKDVMAAARGELPSTLHSGLAAPPLEGAELSAAVSALAACGDWDRVTSLLDLAEAEGRAPSAVGLCPALVSARQRRENPHLLRLMRTAATVSELPSLADGVVRAAAAAALNGKPAQSLQPKDRRVIPNPAAAGGRSASVSASGTTGLAQPALGGAGVETWAETEEWSRAAAAGFAVELAADEAPRPPPAAAARWRTKEVADLSRGAVGKVLGFSDYELNTRAARDAAGVMGTSMAAGAAAAAAAGPHGLALGAVAGMAMAAGMARVHSKRVAAVAAAAAKSSSAAAAAAAAAAAVSSPLAASPTPSTVGGLLRRGRWWWDVRSYESAASAAGRLGDWRAALAILQSLNSIPRTAFSKPPPATADDAASAPNFEDYAMLRSLGMAPPTTPTPTQSPRDAAARSAESADAPHVQHVAHPRLYTHCIAACLADGTFESLGAAVSILAMAEKAGAASGPAYGAAMQTQVKLVRRIHTHTRAHKVLTCATCAA